MASDLSQSDYKTPVCLSLPESLVALIDQKRGLVSRSAYILHILQAALGKATVQIVAKNLSSGYVPEVQSLASGYVYPLAPRVGEKSADHETQEAPSHEN